MSGADIQPRYLVKVGGSVLDAGRAAAVVAALPFDRRETVFLAGGGARADQVRAAQKRDGFDDATAHRFALEAMNDMADCLAAVAPHLAVVGSLDAVGDTLSAGLCPVIRPWPALSRDVLLPENWSATSDAIAARLAEIVGTAVVLVKSVDTHVGQSASDLAEAGIVDSEFPRIVRRSFLKWAVLGPAEVSAVKPVVHWHQG